MTSVSIEVEEGIACYSRRRKCEVKVEGKEKGYVNRENAEEILWKGDQARIRRMRHEMVLETGFHVSFLPLLPVASRISAPSLAVCLSSFPCRVFFSFPYSSLLDLETHAQGRGAKCLFPPPFLRDTATVHFPNRRLTLFNTSFFFSFLFHGGVSCILDKHILSSRNATL